MKFSHSTSLNRFMHTGIDSSESIHCDIDESIQKESESVHGDADESIQYENESILYEVNESIHHRDKSIQSD